MKNITTLLKGSRLLVPFGVGSLVIVVVTLIILNVFLTEAAERAALKHAEEVGSKIGAQFNHLLAVDPEVGNANGGGALTTSSLKDNRRLAGLVADWSSGLGILRLHIFSPDGELLFSTDAGSVEANVSGLWLVHAVAASGQPVSHVEEEARSAAYGWEGSVTLNQETYIPLWDRPNAPAGERKLAGVVEIYHRDVGHKLAVSLESITLQMLVMVGALTLLFAAMLIAILRFEVMLKRSVVEQERLQAKASELSVAQSYNQQLHTVNLQLEERTLQAEQASRLKSEFLANMSHELRTPLNAIIGFSDVLMGGLQEPLNEDQTDSVKEIRDSGRHLLSLINDILDISKIEAGKLKVEQVPTDLGAIIHHALRTMEPLVAAKSHTLRVDVADDLPLVLADSLRVRQILLNLLSNAVKFTPAGGRLTVSAHLAGEMTQVSIADNGIGIPADLFASVFRKFERVERKGTHELNEGTGLGLPLARDLVQLHGGAMWCESEVGKGSTFHFTLWVANSAGAEDSADQPMAA